MIRTAALSSDGGKYRYRLARIWDETNARRVVFVMLNPSTADSTIDDPTIRKCIGFAKQWGQGFKGALGFGGIVVLNLFALRATDPAELMKDDDPIGPENDDYIRKEAWAAKAAGSLIVFAWGANRAVGSRSADVIGIFRRQAFDLIFRIGPLTAEGHPRHPLYLPYSSTLEPF